MRKVIVILSLVLVLAGGQVCADEIEKAKAFIKIADYANAVAVLHKLAQQQPTNIEVRYLMAKAFAECPQQLLLPGSISVGRSNEQRATYQLKIMTKIGPKGRLRLIKMIGKESPRLVTHAVKIAGEEKMTDAIEAIVAFTRRTDGAPNEWFASRGAAALSRIGGAKAAGAIHKMIGGDFNRSVNFNSGVNLGRGRAPRRNILLVDLYLRALDDAELIKLASEEKDAKLLHRLLRLKEAPANVHVAVFSRRELPMSLRLSAMRQLPSNKAKAVRGLAATVVKVIEKDPAAATLRPIIASRIQSWAPEQAADLAEAALRRGRPARHDGSMLRILAAAKGDSATNLLMDMLKAKCDSKRYERWQVSRQVVWTALRQKLSDDALVEAALLMAQPTPKWRSPSSYFAHWIKRESGLSAPLRTRVLERLSGSADVEERRCAVYGLASLPDKPAIKHYWSLAGDDDEKIRKHATAGLVNMGIKGALTPEELLKIVAQVQPQHVSRLLKALVRRPKKEYTDVFIAALKDAVNPKTEVSYRTSQANGETLAAAVEFFDAFPDQRATDLFTSTFFRSSSINIQDRLAKAVRKCSTDLKPVRKRLVDGLSHENVIVRRKCAIALRTLGDASVIPALAKAARRATNTSERAEFDAAIREIVCPAKEAAKP